MKVKRDLLTDEQVELEIERLTNSEAVELARKEMRIKYRRRQAMYTMRSLEKRGQQLLKDGYTLENIEQRMLADIEDVEE